MVDGACRRRLPAGGRREEGRHNTDFHGEEEEEDGVDTKKA